MKINITQKDFENLGVLAGNCDNKKLGIAIVEALNFDLVPVFKDCSVSVKNIILKVINWDGVDEQAKPTNHENELVNGLFFTHKNKDFENLGLKKGLIYYAYGRYVIINGMSDAQAGMVQKTNNFSIPIPQKDLEAISNKYRNMGRFAFESSFEFIALHQHKFPTLECLNLDNCHCNELKKSDSINTKGFGFSGGNVYRKH